MRSLCALILVVASCGGGTKRIDNSAKPAARATGMANLDWGASAAAVTAAYPRATPNKDGGLWSTANVEGIEAITAFKLGANGLEQIRVEWTSGFVSMEDCAKTWTALRPKFDARFGASQADNLAAYWKTPTSSITLACNPNDNGTSSGVLSMTYEPPDHS